MHADRLTWRYLGVLILAPEVSAALPPPPRCGGANIPQHGPLRVDPPPNEGSGCRPVPYAATDHLPPQAEQLDLIRLVGILHAHIRGDHAEEPPAEAPRDVPAVDKRPSASTPALHVQYEVAFRRSLPCPPRFLLQGSEEG